MTAIFAYSTDRLKKIRDDFVIELVKASQGTKSSLSFIRNPLPKKSFVLDNQIFQVIVIGGSVLKKALFKKNHDQIILLNQNQSTIPTIANKEIFFETFVTHLDTQIDVVILNFAYEIKPLVRNGLIDGKLTSPSKEHQFLGLVNKLIGQELENFVWQKLKKKIKVAVINDAVCLLLSGLEKNNYQSLVAGIVGAGTNLAFFLNKNIAINLEAGNFNKFPQSETGKMIDKNSSLPGNRLFEKEVSGSYLYQHYNLLINRGGKKRPLLSTYELSQRAESDLRGQTQSVVTARKLIEHSASLIACQIAGIYKFKALTLDDRSWKLDKEVRRSRLENLTSNLQPQNLASSLQHPTSRLSFIMEGSLFWHGWQYQNFVYQYLNLLGVPKSSIEFVNINNSGIIGASRLITG